MRLLLAMAAVGAVTLSVPAAAQQQLITFTGTSFLAPSGTPLAGLQFLNGLPMSGSFLIDTQAAGFQPGAPAGGLGTSGFLTGAILAGQINLAGGAVTLLRNGNDFGNIFTVNDGAVPGQPNRRIDQMGYSTGSRLVAGSIVQPYTIFGPLPPDIFFSSLFFGRTQLADLPQGPQMITDVTTRDFAGVLSGPLGTPPFLSIRFVQGNPAGGVLAGLPGQQISIGNFQYSITNVGGAVPEPASWAMLIMGFGLVGASARRRRMALAA
jgi:hypothetical protein